MKTNKYSDFEMVNQLSKDLKEFVAAFPLYEELRNSTILITGATGLIGASCVRCLNALNERHNLNVSIVCAIRNVGKAKAMFQGMNSLEYCECDFMLGKTLQYNENSIDFIIHCASPTASKFFIDSPVETLSTAWNGCQTILEYSRQNGVKSIVFVSSLEVYGAIEDDTKYITEDVQGYINPLEARSSYSMGKRMAECLCKAYTEEYGVKVKIARLTQTFGAGVAATDNRVFAQFARSAINGENIVLHTKGHSAKPYCYTTDCVSALLYILLRGQCGEAYNVANEDTYISIRDMANLICQEFRKTLRVKIEPNPNMGYAPTTKLKLSSKRLGSLGWQPNVSLKNMFERLINYLRYDI